MKPITKLMKNEFIERTGIKPIMFRLLTGSMKEYVNIRIKGNKQNYEKLRENKAIGDIKITFMQDFTYFKNPCINLDVHLTQFKSFMENRIR